MDGLLVTDVTYHNQEKNTLATFCIMWAKFTVKSMKRVAERRSDPGLHIYDVVVFGIDSRKDYRALMTRKEESWKIEFFVPMVAV